MKCELREIIWIVYALRIKMRKMIFMIQRIHTIRGGNLNGSYIDGLSRSEEPNL